MQKQKWYKCPEPCQWAEPKGWWQRMGYRVWFPLLCFPAACFFILTTVWRCCMSTKTSAKQEVRMPWSRTHLWNEANQNKRLQESHLQVDHEFNESLAVMHFVHGYRLCWWRRKKHRSQCSTLGVLNASYLDMWVYPKTNQLLLQTALRMTVRKNDCSTNCNGTQIMYFCHNWQALLKKKNSSVQGFTQGQT